MEKLLKRYPELKGVSEDIEKTVTLLADMYRSGGKLLCCGNGGSASDSEHIVGELMKCFKIKRPIKKSLPTLKRKLRTARKSLLTVKRNLLTVSRKLPMRKLRLRTQRYSLQRVKKRLRTARKSLPMLKRSLLTAGKK